MDKETDDLDGIIAQLEAETVVAPAHLKQQWHDSIDRVAAVERQHAGEQETKWHPTSFFWGFAVSAALAVGIAIGIFVNESSPDPVDSTLAQNAETARTMPVAFSRGLQHHFRSSQEQLEQLDGSEDSVMLVLRLIEQNRHFERAAETEQLPRPSEST